METQINSPNFLYDAIDAGNLKRVKRLFKVKSLDCSQVSVAINIAMNAKIGKKVRNEIIKSLLAHPEFKVSEGLESGEIRNGVLHTWIKEGDLDLVKVAMAHSTFHVIDACGCVFTAIESEHLRKPSNEKLQNDMINILLPKVLEYPEAYFVFKANFFSLLNIAITIDQLKNVETLLQHPKIDVNECYHPTKGQSPEALPGQKVTPLMASMMCNSKNNDITKILLQHPKIDVNKTDADTCLPLSLILNNLNNERDFSCLELLLNHGNIDVNKKDEYLKVTPLVDLAQRNTDNQRERCGRNLDSNGAQFYEDKALKLLLAHPKIDLEMKDAEGKNVLHHMIISILWDDTLDEDLSQHKARFGSWYEIISDLLKTHPSLITPDNDGYTPIDIAMEELRDPFYLMKDIIDNHFNNITKETTDKEPKETTDKELIETTLKEPQVTTDQEPSKTAPNPDKICWNCDAEDVKLYKCTGCKKAYYCSRSCITQDWEIHGGYCVKKQQKRQNRKS